MTSILFFPVKGTQAKLLKICEIATLHVQKREKLIILVSDQIAFEFVDELLWKLPEEGFLPHPNSFLTIETEPNGEATALFNLQQTAFLQKDSFKKIYELEDYTSSEKLQLSKQRYQMYRNAGYPITIEE
jgi:DNA polymerase IIIc chi subunit